jgi:heme/copper-type cytochrome/quinol oxidase subunit 2
MTYDKAIEVTNNPAILISLGILFFLTLVIFLSWGCLAKARTSDGRIVPKTHVISTANFWISWILLWVLPLILLLVFFVFPVYLIPFS